MTGSSTDKSVVPTFGKVNICFAAGNGVEDEAVILLPPHPAKAPSSAHNRIVTVICRCTCALRTQRCIKDSHLPNKIDPLPNYGVLLLNQLRPPLYYFCTCTSSIAKIEP